MSNVNNVKHVNCQCGMSMSMCCLCFNSTTLNAQLLFVSEFQNMNIGKFSQDSLA